MQLAELKDGSHRQDTRLQNLHWAQGFVISDSSAVWLLRLFRMTPERGDSRGRTVRHEAVTRSPKPRFMQYQSLAPLPCSGSRIVRSLGALPLASG